ncbi:MAG: hypothetical protein ACSLEN_08275 [Candidatus Malihini olakiniferum]
MVDRLLFSDMHFRRISQLIYQRAGIVLADHKREMVYNPPGKAGCRPWGLMILGSIWLSVGSEFQQS